MNAILKADGISKKFGAVTAANDLWVAVPKGATYSLIGANGAGKTTFVNMITGYITPDTGQIMFEGADITGLEPRAITRLGISRSFQIPQLYTELTVLENILTARVIANRESLSFWRFAKNSADIDAALHILERFNLVEQRDLIIRELAGGMRKVLDIAMAMSGKPKVMLLDEPTSGVASAEKFSIMDLVMGALSDQDVTIIFVEHDMEIVTRYSERVLAFYDGRIIANDAPSEVLSDPEVQRYVTGTVK